MYGPFSAYEDDVSHDIGESLSLVKPGWSGQTTAESPTPGADMESRTLRISAVFL